MPLELATWRYGTAIRRRRRRFLLGTAATVVGGTAMLIGGIPFAALGALPAASATLISQIVGNALPDDPLDRLDKS